MVNEQYNGHFTDVLDRALDRLAHEPLAQILADYPDRTEDLRPLLEAAAGVQALPEAPDLPAAALSADRQRFLAGLDALPAPRRQRRLAAWLPLLPWLRPAAPGSPPHKEKKTMTFIAKTIATLALMFGLGGSAVVMTAADSLPDSPLYPVKIAVEETRLALTGDPVGQGEMHLALAQNRLREMERQLLAGEVPGAAVQNRLEHHLREALRLTASAPEAEMAGLLARIQIRIQEHTQTMTRLQEQAGPAGQEALGEALQVMRRLGQEAAFGLQEPQQFRTQQQRGEVPAERPCLGAACDPVQNQEQKQEHNGFGPGEAPGEPGVGPGPGNPQNGPGPNPNCPGDDCDPQQNKAENQLKEQQQNQEQNGPGPAGTPGQNCTGDCDPVQQQEQEQEQEQERQQEQAGPGQPAGSNEPAPQQEQEQEREQEGASSSPGSGSPSGGSGGSDNSGGSGGSGGAGSSGGSGGGKP